MPAVFQFGKHAGKKVATSVKPRAIDKPPAAAKEVVGLIQGRVPMSIIEWRVSLALNRLHLGYIYQYSIAGGSRHLSGGQVIDFFVYTHPLPTPVYVQGGYWHGGAKSYESQLKVAMANKLFKGRAMPVVQLWEKDLSTDDAAFLTVKEALHQ